MIDADRLTGLLQNWLATELVVVDVGARWGIGDRWGPFGSRVTVFGFDPDEDECARLNHEALLTSEGTSVRYIPIALGRSPGDAILHLTKEPGCSSIYAPRQELLHLRPDLSVIEADGTAEVAITTFDEWAEAANLSHVDVFKLDTQGSELGVLEGATGALASVQMIEVEVEFNEIYEGQPLFGDVDRFLRDRGFVLWRLQQLVHYGFPDPHSGMIALRDTHYFDSQGVEFAGRGGQLFWGHAYFVPSRLAFPSVERLSWDAAVRAACAATAFGFTDLALNTLHGASGVPDEAALVLARLDVRQ